MKKLFCLQMALLCLASAALSEEETEQKAERMSARSFVVMEFCFAKGFYAWFHIVRCHLSTRRSACGR